MALAVLDNIWIGPLGALASKEVLDIETGDRGGGKGGEAALWSAAAAPPTGSASVRSWELQLVVQQERSQAASLVAATGALTTRSMFIS